MKWVIREQQKRESEFNAGSKARNDVNTILVNEGFNPLIANSELDESQGVVKKVLLQFTRYSEWKKCIKKLNTGDIVIIQYPVRNHTVFFGNVLKAIQKKNVMIIGIIHDLESLRLAISKNSPAISRIRFKYEELTALKHFSKLIVHNEYMRRALHDFFKVPMDKMINLEIFDYLYTLEYKDQHAVYGGPILIAGNLDKIKCGYAYDLPEGINFHLYGANYNEKQQKCMTAKYMGRVKPDELPCLLKGSFGLVWDGPTGDGCKGVFGEYLKYNNPHKASLYLASGLPVIVWSESAMASFVKVNKCGLLVDNLNQIPQILGKLSSEEYYKMINSALSVGAKLRIGYYTEEAISKSLC